MKQYPSITKKVTPNSYIYAFDKLDGSNIRAEWSKKKGFWKFGTKTRLVDETDSIFGQAPKLILDKYGDELGRILHKNNWDRSICFFEFYGENSEFGVHKDEDHTVTLIDVNVYKKGLLSPKDFVQLFENLGIPKLLYSGYAHADFVEQVCNGTLPSMTFEGVVCKTNSYNPDMFKIKNRAWLDRLREHCAGDEKLFEMLA